jgi:hypothetical protein
MADAAERPALRAPRAPALAPGRWWPARRADGLVEVGAGRPDRACRRLARRGTPPPRSTCGRSRHAGPGRPPRPPAPDSERGAGQRPRPADLARPLHLPARARLRPLGRRGPGAQPPGAHSRPPARPPCSPTPRSGRTRPTRRSPRPRSTASAPIIGKVMMDRDHLRHRHRAGRDPRDEPAPVGRARRAMARPGRRAAAVRVHAALRGQLQRRDAARVGGARRAARRVLADPPVGGRGRDRRGAPSLPGTATTSTCTTRRERSGPRRSSPTPSTSPTARWRAWSRADPASRTARPRTSSSRAG